MAIYYTLEPIVYTSEVTKRQNHALYKRLAIDFAGFGLIILSFLTGWLPGPGGIPLFLAGLGILSLNYEWAERLMKNFEKKWHEYTTKYLEADPLTSRIMDIFAIIFLGIGIWLATSDYNRIIRSASIGPIILGVLVLLNNQRRFSRFITKIKKHKS